MPKGLMNMMKGIGVGMALGCVVGAIGNQYVHSGRKSLKKSVGKALKNMSDLVDEFGDMF